jgi:hypothetical protein
MCPQTPWFTQWALYGDTGSSVPNHERRRNPCPGPRAPPTKGAHPGGGGRAAWLPARYLAPRAAPEPPPTPEDADSSFDRGGRSWMPSAPPASCCSSLGFSSGEGAGKPREREREKGRQLRRGEAGGEVTVAVRSLHDLISLFFSQRRGPSLETKDTIPHGPVSRPTDTPRQIALAGISGFPEAHGRGGRPPARPRSGPAGGSRGPRPQRLTIFSKRVHFHIFKLPNNL